MIIEQRTRDKHQNADSLSKKREFCERQEQREADRPEIKDGFSFMDKETYDGLPLTRWLDKSGKPIEDHPELPEEPPKKTILKKTRGMPIGIMLKSKIVRETLKAKGYDLNQVETGDTQIDEDLWRLLEKLADDKPVNEGKGREEPEVTILRRSETVGNADSLRGSVTDGKEVVRSLVDKIADNILERTQVRKKKVAFKEEAEHLGLGQESGEWSTSTEEEETGEKKLSGECEAWDEDSEKSSDDQASLCMILAEENLRHRDRELQTDPSSGTYNSDEQEVQGGEELEKIAVSRKPFRELSCNSNVRINLVPEDDTKIVKRIICVKLKDDIHNPGEMNGQIMALKEHVKARYRLSDLIDHFTKLAEAVPCQTASAEETCDHLITHWISRYGCPMTFQSDNGKAFVGDLTKELMKRSHIAQAHSTTYHPQTNGLAERRNRTLVNMLRVYCSRYMTDWNKYLPQNGGAYNSAQHSTTGISPFMKLTGRERAMPLTFFYPEYEGRRKSPQAYVKEAIRRQQEINELCRRNTAQVQMRRGKKYDEKILQAKPYEVGQYVWVFQNVIPPKGTKKLLKKWRGPFMITEVHQKGRFYRLSTGRAAHYENLKPHVPSPEYWCIPQDMEGLEYLLVESACEVNEKGTREKNDGIENLSLDDNEKIEADSEAESFVEEDWNDPEQGEVPKWTEPDLPIPAGTRSGNRKRTGMRYNRYGDDFLIDKIQPDELSEGLLSVGELAADDEWQIINDNEHYPKEDYSTPERETDLEQSEIERRENTNLRILEWMRDVKNGSGEKQSIQQVDVSAGKHMKTRDPLFDWTATDRPLEIPPDNLDPSPSTGTSINIFVRGAGVGFTHTENLMIKKLREVRETSELELDGEEAEPTIGRNFKTKFEIPNEYSENILIADSDFILSDRTSAICITADMSFKSRLEADFKREYQNVEFLFRQRPGLGGMAALPPSVARGKYLCFLVTRVSERNTIDPEHVMLALTRLRDFMIERRITEVSMPVYDPNRGKLSPRELYAILPVVFAETEIMVHLHKKYYLSNA